MTYQEATDFLKKLLSDFREQIIVEPTTPLQLPANFEAWNWLFVPCIPVQEITPDRTFEDLILIDAWQPTLVMLFSLRSCGVNYNLLKSTESGFRFMTDQNTIPSMFLSQIEISKRIIWTIVTP